MPESADVLKVAVAGHTNTGKTSLMRTLTRDPAFGKVADSPGTTRRVEGSRLLAQGRPVLELFDTPGMEDGIALLEFLERLPRPGERLDGPARVQRFLEGPEAHGRFEQEARVLRKLLDCDAALYVIDARDPVLGKHRDELAILAGCARPLLPVLNFVGRPPHRADAWREALGRLGLHVQVEFDTVAPALDGEQQLYSRLATLLDRHRPALAALMADLDRQRRERREAAAGLVADMLVDVAALRLPVRGGEDEQAALAGVRERVRAREQQCVEALLALYRFRPGDYAADPLPLDGTRWGMDLFHPQALKDMGIGLGKGMVAGAMAGATLDAFTAGLSLGAATLIGAAAGGLWQGADRLGQRVLGRLRGWRELTVDDPVLRLLALRQQALARALERRGHAARDPLRLAPPSDEAWRSGPLPEALAEARSQPSWSSLSGRLADSPRREAVVRSLAAALLDAPAPADGG